jgi:(E)-4-hydroxy-3-methylbut-2-enyl-diphosphate synthase
VAIGDGAPVSVQSMLVASPADREAAQAELQRVALAGGDVARVAVPDRAAAAALGQLAERSPLPLVADVHFDLDLAHVAFDQGVAGVRVNPGTAGRRPDWRALAARAAATGGCVRVGSNFGSLSAAAREHPGGPAAGLVQELLETAETLADAGAPQLKLSIKSARVPELLWANRRLYERAAARLGTPWPLHVGLTEAGPPPDGEVKSAAALALLLGDGLGDTVRVSLAADPVWQVRAAHRALRALGLSKRGVDVVACPTCARAQGPVIAVACELRARLDELEAAPGEASAPWLRGRTLAVMGCAVNGPAEARSADAGVAAAGDHWVLFARSQPVGRVRSAEVVSRLLAALSDAPGPTPTPTPGMVTSP